MRLHVSQDISVEKKLIHFCRLHAFLHALFLSVLLALPGFYMFIESSAPRVRGDNALFLSPQHPASSGDVCVTFYYSMYGRTVGTLNLRVRCLSLFVETLTPTLTTTTGYDACRFLLNLHPHPHPHPHHFKGTQG